MLKKFIITCLLVGFTATAFAQAPPKRYDYKFPGKVTVHEVPFVTLPFRCGVFALACAYTDHKTWCDIIVAREYSDKEWREKVRHEQAHCNGWPAHHPR